MPSFVHVANERDAKSIRRAGLKLPRVTDGRRLSRPVGVFALPVVPNFLMSHQWVRELKRRGHRTAVGVYFNVPSSEPVWAGLYNESKQAMTAGQATQILREMEKFGFEVIIPRSIAAASITAIRALPQNVGWRYFPDAHARGIFCGCE